MMGSVAHASLPACAPSVSRSRAGESSAFRGVGNNRIGGAGRSVCSGRCSSLPSFSSRVFTRRSALHNHRTRFECRAAWEESASSDERTAPPPPLSFLGMELEDVLRSQPE
eukprot:4768971-Pyramimonas_sp.AAC.1